MLKAFTAKKYFIIVSLALSIGCLAVIDYNGYPYNKAYGSLIALCGFIVPFILSCFLMRREFKMLNILLFVLSLYSMLRTFHAKVSREFPEPIYVMDNSVAGDGTAAPDSVTSSTKATPADDTLHGTNFLIPSVMLVLTIIPIFACVIMKGEFVEAAISLVAALVFILFCILLRHPGEKLMKGLGVIEYILAFFLIIAGGTALFLNSRNSEETVEEVEVTNTYTAEVPKTIVV